MNKIKHKYWILFFLIIFVFVIFIYFNLLKEGCSKKGIHVTPELELQSQNKGRDYCSLLECAMKTPLNDSCLYEMLTVNDLYNSAGYDHGFVLVELIKYHGKEKMSEFICLNLNTKEKENLKYYLRVARDNFREINERAIDINCGNVSN